METKITTMRLTGQCKNHFEHWYYEKYYKSFIKSKFLVDYHFGGFFDSFYELNDSMQYGVYVDFFDSVKIVIELQVRTTPTMQGGSFTCIRPSILSVGKFYNVGASFVVRDRARTEAIKKANEIYNKQQIIANVKKPNANIL